jgi:hypothetical protein
VRRALLLLIICSITSVYKTGCAIDMEMYKSRLVGPDQIQIAKTGIEMPLGRLLLIRKDQDYCVVRFSKFWTGQDEKERFASYEAYFQGDRTGDFSKSNVKVSLRKASFLIPRGIGRFYFQLGDEEVRCGPFRLGWAYKGFVGFYGINQHSGDYGIQLAPTPWTNMKEVNVFDQRIKWYRYGQQQETVNIPIDKLWEGEK